MCSCLVRLTFPRILGFPRWMRLTGVCCVLCRAGSSNSMESLSGGFVYGAGGSGFITPRLWMTPLPSGSSSPVRPGHGHGHGHHQDGAGQGELGLEMSMDPQHTSPVTA